METLTIEQLKAKKKEIDTLIKELENEEVCTENERAKAYRYGSGWVVGFKYYNTVCPIREQYKKLVVAEDKETMKHLVKSIINDLAELLEKLAWKAS